MTHLSPALRKAVAANRRRILAREATIAGLIAGAFRQAQAQITPSQQALLNAYAAELDALHAQTLADDEEADDSTPAAQPTVPSSWAQQSGQLPRLNRTILLALSAFALTSRMHITDGQRQAVVAGAQDAQALIRTALDPLTAHLSIEMVDGLVRGAPGNVLDALVGKSLTTGNPLSALLDTLGEPTAAKVTQTLYAALASGAHPSVAARMLTQATGMARNRALTVARTEMIGAYRHAAVDTFQASADVLQGWVWLAAADACPFCQSMNGTFHSLNEYLDSHPNCFPAGTMVSGPRPVGSTARRYVGEVVEIDTAGGHHLTVTPNHPILTPHGWVAAGLLNEGGYVISRRREQLGHTPPIANPDDDDVDAPIEQVAVSLRGASTVSTVSMPTAAEDFHGDGIGSQVHIVRADSLLRRHGDASLLQPLAQQHLCRRHTQLAALTSGSALLQSLNRVFIPTASDMGSSGIGPTLFGCTAGLQELVGFGLSSTGRVRFVEHAGDDTAGYAVPTAESILRFAGQVAPDQIISINRRAFSGHVYNLQTAEQWYIANSIIAHNCRCCPSPVTKPLSDILSQFAA